MSIKTLFSPVLLIMLSLASTCAFAQPSSFTIRGKVLDNKSNPIAGATVSILNSIDATISNDDGIFQFKNMFPARYTIRISAVGYAATTFDITVSKGVTGISEFVLPDANTRLDDVVVTAEKKEERLQMIPLSLSALTSKEVKEYRLWNAKDLTALVPNLYSANSGDERNVSFIRGIGTTSYDPAIATYIDGVSQFTLDTYNPQLLDIERIEVLRGPQGTLYGRNAMGGVINIITKQPSEETSAFADFSFGNYNLQRYQAGFSTPLIKEKLYLGVAGMFNQRNGYYFNTYRNERFDNQHFFFGNYYLKYRPAGKWMVTLNIKNQANRNDGAFTLAGSADEAFEHPFQIQQNAKGKMIDNTLLGSVSISYSGNTYNFSSQTTYQSNLRYYQDPVDGDFSPLDAVTIINDYGKPWNKVKTWTQEFKLTSKTSSDFQWTAGIYLYSDKQPTKQATHYGSDAGLLGLPDVDFSSIHTGTIMNNGVAFYGQGAYSIDEKLSLTLGLRYDYGYMDYSLKGEYQKDGQPVIVTLADTSAASQYGAFSPKIGLDYKLNPQSNLYVTYSRGFRTGGMTPLSDDPSQPPLFEYAPEYSNNIELGMKNSLLNKKLYANFALFLTTITNAQVPTLVLPEAFTVIRNAGKLRSKGVEAELSATPVKGMQVTYNFGYTDAQYTNLKLSQNGMAVNLDGKKQIFTPDVTSMFAVQYGHKIKESSNTNLVVRGEWFYIGKQYFDLSNSITQEPYSLFNTRFGISTKHFSLMFWGRNLGNKRYISYAYDFGAVHLGDPKTYGATLSLNL